MFPDRSSSNWAFTLETVSPSSLDAPSTARFLSYSLIPTNYCEVTAGNLVSTPG